MSNKLKKKPSTRLSPELMTAAEVSGITGVKLEILRKWVDRMQRNLSEAYQKEAQEKLLKAERLHQRGERRVLGTGDL